MTHDDKKYLDAKSDLLKALKSFNELKPGQKEYLIKEMIGADTAMAMYNIMQRYFGGK